VHARRAGGSFSAIRVCSSVPGNTRLTCFVQARIFVRGRCCDVSLPLRLCTLHPHAGAFESNIVHHEAEGFEQMASRFCENKVSSLLMDIGETFHGQMTNDWALKGSRSASVLSIVRCGTAAMPLRHLLHRT
jgi:hypothetical protein